MFKWQQELRIKISYEGIAWKHQIFQYNLTVFVRVHTILNEIQSMEHR